MSVRQRQRRTQVRTPGPLRYIIPLRHARHRTSWNRLVDCDRTPIAWRTPCAPHMLRHWNARRLVYVVWLGVSIARVSALLHLLLTQRAEGGRATLGEPMRGGHPLTCTSFLHAGLATLDVEISHLVCHTCVRIGSRDRRDHWITRGSAIRPQFPSTFAETQCIRSMQDMAHGMYHEDRKHPSIVRNRYDPCRNRHSATYSSFV